MLYNYKQGYKKHDSLHAKQIQIQCDGHLFRCLISSKEDSLPTQSELDI